MTDPRCATPVEFTDIVDYWAGDLSAADVDRIEEHAFTCAACAGQLAEGEALARGIAAVVREGRFHSVVTDGLLNRLAMDGVRMRTYVLEPGDVVPCSVWEDDDLVVTRIRADLSGADSVTVVTRLGSGEEVSRSSDVMVRPGQVEIIDAISAALLRRLPATRVQMTVIARAARGEWTLGDYVLEHAGTFDRARRGP